MSQRSIQDILPLVQMPSRYLGSEVNRVLKSWEKAQVHVALAFPDLYEIGTSHFGIQILYGMLNAREEILAERIFAPATDMEAQLRKNHLPLCSLESETPLRRFDIVGFSLLYELNYTNMVNMLDLGEIPFFAEQRRRDHPFVIAGGPCTCNPEPVADFFDAIVVGDGEAVILRMMDAWKSWRQTEGTPRSDLLRRWSRIEGVYVPSFFEFKKDDQGRWRLFPKNESYQTIERSVVPDLNLTPFPSKPIIPFGKPIHDRLRMEIARGCTRGCRFCQAGMIYRPVREREPEGVAKAVKQLLEETGYEDLSLLSLSTGDYSCIAPLMKHIMAFGERDCVAVSLPSLRAGSLTTELMELIQKVRKTGFTIAPEAGSQRLRDVINKNISEADIVDTVKNAFALGWRIIKLYFMIGLPTETQADIEAIVDLVKRLRNVADQKGNRGKINVSIATFVPKPHTPFQWEPQIRIDTALEKMNWLKEQLSLTGVQMKWQDPRVSVIEGIWARGDRRLGKVLVNAWKSGRRFDGWSDFFDYEQWISIFKKCGIHPESFTDGCADTGQPLPWDHINIGVKRSFLIKEKQRALAGERSEDCRTGLCSGCGVCNFDTIEPISFHRSQENGEAESVDGKINAPKESIRYMINFRKMNTARFLGHLEMVKIFIRGLRRAKIPLKYSAGFHPMPKVSFRDTLPMGMQSEDEKMIIILTESMEPEVLIQRLQPQLPNGLDVTGCQPFDRKQPWDDEHLREYHIELKDGFLRKKDLDSFFRQPSITIERKSKKGKRTNVDLKKAISQIRILDSSQALMTLGKDNQLTLRPAPVLKAIFQLSEQQIQTAIITKRKAKHV